MSSMMRIDESLALMAEAAQKSAAAQERRAAAEERRVALEERNAASLERYAAAAERAALIHEAALGDSQAARKEVNEFFAKLATELHAAIPLVLAKMAGVDVASAAEQAEEEEAEEEEEEGQQPEPVAVEAPAKPEPAAKAEPEPAPVEVKQEEEDKPAAVPDETASEDKAEQAATYLQTSQFLRKFRAIQAEYMPPDEINREAQMKIAKNLNLPRLVVSTPEQRQKILNMYRAEMEKYYKTGKL